LAESSTSGGMASIPISLNFWSSARVNVDLSLAMAHLYYFLL